MASSSQTKQQVITTTTSLFQAQARCLSISDLPIDLTAFCLSFLKTQALLSVLPRVCKSWYDACNQSLAWNVVSFPATLRPRVLGLHVTYYCRLWSHVTSLDLTDCVHLTDEAVKLMLLRSMSLRRLSLAGCTSLTDAVLQQLARLHPKYLLTDSLRSHAADPRYIQQDRTSSTSSLSEGRNRPMLVELRLDQLNALTDVGLQEVAKVYSSSPLPPPF